MNSRDWHAWHARYNDPDSAFSRRLRIVQRAIIGCLGVRRDCHVLSICAGQGHDILGVLAARRAAAGTVTLVESDAANCAVASAVAAEAGLANVRVICGDASLLSTFDGVPAADLILVCGVLGNLADRDANRLIHALPMLLAASGQVVWTRNTRYTFGEPSSDRTPQLRQAFESAGFAEISFEPVPGTVFAVGSHRLIVDPPQRVDEDGPLFRFVTRD